VKLDVSDRASVEAAAGVVKGELGWVDVLVNNAGYLEEFRAIGESDPEGWWRTWEVVFWSASCFLFVFDVPFGGGVLMGWGRRGRIFGGRTS